VVVLLHATAPASDATTTRDHVLIRLMPMFWTQMSTA
jgi:hypothetical protein